jgi:hypothetical protein
MFHSSKKKIELLATIYVLETLQDFMKKNTKKLDVACTKEKTNR